MKLAIVGQPQSGKSTIFAALTGARGEGGSPSSRTDPRIANIQVHDDRIDTLSGVYRPKKTTYARIEYLLPAALPAASPSKSVEGGKWNQARTCDGLILVVRNFQAPGGTPPDSERNYREMEEEMILSDLVVTEKRLERIELDKKRGKSPEGEEESLLKSCREVLDRGEPLRRYRELALHPVLKGFTFLSAKPMLIIVNNDDEDEALPSWGAAPVGAEVIAVRGRLEMDIATMDPEEAKEFQVAYHIGQSALDRVIQSSFRLLNRISFFTVGPDEVKAWPITRGTPAVEAAGEVHSDIQKGFIRAEVLSYDDFQTYGGFQETKKAGHVRLEGKEYEVKDGDIINFRFNV
jgi:ribosome-binding ATPase